MDVLVTTLEADGPGNLWEMMNRRWDIEENGVPPVEDVLPCKALLLPCGSGSDI